MGYSFRDDYSDGVHPEILEHILAHNGGQQRTYGEDEYCDRASQKIRLFFGLPEASVYFVPSGTLANVVCLDAMLASHEAIVATEKAHMYIREAGAVGRLGYQILAHEPIDGKLTVEHVKTSLEKYKPVKNLLPKVVHLSQATEVGTLYNHDELLAITKCAKDNAMLAHIDGARLAMSLGSPESTMTPEEFGQLGIDAFSIGGTKVGGLYGEAVVVNNLTQQPFFKTYMKQQGAVLGKGRFLGLQFDRFFADDSLWLNIAKKITMEAARLRSELSRLGAVFEYSSGSNQIFPVLPTDVVTELEKRFDFNKIDEFLTFVGKL